jgi:hypothetical protein
MKEYDNRVITPGAVPGSQTWLVNPSAAVAQDNRTYSIGACIISGSIHVPDVAWPE